MRAASACAAAAPQETPAVVQTGVIVRKVLCAKQPEQSYALFVPSSYTPSRAWPVVFVFDPAARGSLPLEAMNGAAERHGFLLAGSNNSRNGPWKPELEAAQAMVEDVRGRFAIDDRRVYFAGFSGGARVAAALAIRCRCGAGVLLDGAGFPPDSSASPEAPFAVFSAAGYDDFNFPEVVRLDESLEKLHFPHALGFFKGPHEWAPGTVMEDAFGWFRLIAMQQSREPRDQKMIDETAALFGSRIAAMESSGDSYGAWREARQALAALHGLASGTALEETVLRLGALKSVREGAKRERAGFDEQERLDAPIASGMAALAEKKFSDPDLRSRVATDLSDLRMRAGHEKNPEKLRVLNRALGGIVVEAAEAGGAQFEAKRWALAAGYFELALVANPEAFWPRYRLAVARAMEGNRKGALEALRAARETTKDPAAFPQLLSDEPGFASLRGTSEFNSLLAGDKKAP